MYKIINNYLSESEFKDIKDWYGRQSCSPGNQNWNSKLLHDGGVEIKKPCIGTRFPFLGRGYNSNIKIDENIHNLKDKILITMNETYDYFSYGDIKELQIGLYNFEYGSGILLHRDASVVGNSSDNLSLRWGITLYLNEKWEKNWGGETIIYSGGDNMHSFQDEKNISSELEPIKVVYPESNKLMIVDGEWHKVIPNLNKKENRKSIQIFISANFNKSFLQLNNKTSGE